MDPFLSSKNTKGGQKNEKLPYFCLFCKLECPVIFFSLFSWTLLLIRADPT